VIRRASFTLAIAICVMLVAGQGRAQSSIEVTADLSSSVVEIDEGFMVEMRAMGDSGVAPSSPTLRPPAGIRCSGPSVSQRTMAHFGGGRSLIKRGIGATWQCVASAPGGFRIPNPTVIADGKVVTARADLRIRVVPSGQGTRPRSRRGRRGRSFGGIFNFPSGPVDDRFPDDDEEEEKQLSPRAKELALKREPDSYVFVRMVADKDSVVVGEQISLSYYVYYRTDLQLTVQREPALADFLRMQLDKSDGADEPVITSVGTWRYHVKLLDRVAVFPLRAGKLKTGILTAKFKGSRFSGRELERTSNELEIDVREPPLKGRPVGYRVGDVGRFTLTAKVSPRETVAGETVAVLVRLTGTGALPSSLKIPERVGVEWLRPEKNEDITVRRGKITGWRSFGYAVRLSRPGEIELGKVELPFFDAKKGEYQVASVELGSVRVRKGKGDAKTSTQDAADDDPFSSLAKPRNSFGEFVAIGDAGFDPLVLWTLVLLPPFGVAFSGMAWSTLGKLRRRREQRERDPAVLAKRALADAQRAETPKDAAAAAERAIHLAVEAASGVKSRGVLLTDLPARLVERDLDEALVARVVRLLEQCSAILFEPGDEPAGADAVVLGTRALLKDLLRLSPQHAGETV